MDQVKSKNKIIFRQQQECSVDTSTGSIVYLSINCIYEIPIKDCSEHATDHPANSYQLI